MTGHVLLRTSGPGPAPGPDPDESEPMTDTAPPEKLTAEHAADIARARGLTMADAVSLRALADDVDTAEKIADRFATQPSAAQIADHLTRQMGR